MAYSAKILADSVNPCGNRLVTMEITYPRFVHAELMTHRMLSRNSASSRAIPISKMIESVQKDPVMPVWWGKNQQGMQADEELSGVELEAAKFFWLLSRDLAVDQVRTLTTNEVVWQDNPIKINLHKQIANRLLEPWLYITVIVSATEWENFFHLRCHPDAQPEIRRIAEMMRELYEDHEPKEVYPTDWLPWHLPLVNAEDLEEWHKNIFSTNDLCKLSVGRCCRVSYLTHDGKRDPQADLDLCDRLIAGSGGVGHFSPFEHVARALDKPGRSGNFIGWHQLRKDFVGEDVGDNWGRTAEDWEQIAEANRKSM